MPTTLAFPSKADMMCVGALREDWLSALNGHSDVAIDCSVVTTISAAAAQLVFSLAKTMQSQGGSVKLMHVSDMLRDDFILLGLQEFI